ncbi:MFS transporter [Qipengyuania zhejiangensis]|uniref:MFS transporter n=1 Tax=Qipengyuania zhejiangensis TaxID=3077782 RepID=UPI002D7960EA|nr:MFS transporter [Qipengyuania sp. Z2]
MTGPGSTYPSERYGFYVVAVLMLLYMLSFVDRVLISLMIEPIKDEFRLSDTQVGLLVGFSFVLLYSVMGIPFGMMADRFDRRKLILVGVVGWSLATSVSGLAVGYVQLLLARTAVGIGEAALSPAAISTIADRFRPHRLGIAVAIYSLGVTLGGGLAMAGGGLLIAWANATRITLPLVGMLSGWRLALFSVGLLGIPFAVLIVLTIREAPRLGKRADKLSIGEVFTFMSGHRRAFLALLAGYSACAVASYVPLLWAPAFYARDFGLAPSEIGLRIGAMVAILGLSGVLMGGRMSDRFLRNGRHDAPVRVILISILLQLPSFALAYLVADVTWSMVFIGVGIFTMSMFGSLQATTIQLMMPGEMRGRMMGIYLLVVNLVGMGLAPLIIGILSDAMGGQLGRAMAIVSTGSLAMSLIFLVYGKSAMRDMISANLCPPSAPMTE